MSTQRFAPGITTLLRRHRRWVSGQRIGLVSHPAAVDERGFHTADLLANLPDAALVALFGPEHGFLGDASAGNPVHRRLHPRLRIPVHSLYGRARRPRTQALAGVDVLVFDLQCIPARPYTYATTLRYVMEAMASAGKRLIVADRAVPLPRTVDGPMLEPKLESFVSGIPTPTVYGMTPGELALWLRDALDLEIDLRIASMQGYSRDLRPGHRWPPWIPPSPAIPTWETAEIYPATVCFEAIPSIDYGRGSGLPFRVFGAPWICAGDLLDYLAASRLRGVVFHPHTYRAASGTWADHVLNGLRLSVADPAVFRPVQCAVTILAGLQELYGPRKLWHSRGAGADFFDHLLGAASAREAIHSGNAAREAAAWRKTSARFVQSRCEHLLYNPTGGRDL